MHTNREKKDIKQIYVNDLNDLELLLIDIFKVLLGCEICRQSMRFSNDNKEFQIVLKRLTK